MVIAVTKTQILLAFGGNLPSPAGEPRATIAAAVAALEARGFELVSASAHYRTPAVTLEEGVVSPPYVNAAAHFRTSLTADEVLAATQETEREFGRMPAARWTARPLDIDLLAYGDAILPDAAQWRSVAGSADPAAILPEPVVPHPRLHLRGFVLAPLLDIAPAWQHPVLGKTVRDMAADAKADGAFEGIEKLA
ncbi:2-amino-4-hydroxy-6-hydroxymethyldihydropteridine diphosphokinase [Kordiimonas gwangyangensis]|uniref:2-amino-4-hydroxy-6- hydroxymethyldihydropteridine diphosphokinase n=1 Tax=Kordiimonas gwangyangensis TaxID=288022 RepID=UPI00037154B7|nr:2-amino-4-hydroxy-6-hydroxymethyldihydropteridine diphosphokinase [Kordiimonas gwangyangensis]